MQQEVFTKKPLEPARKGAWVGRLQERLDGNERRRLRIVSMSRASIFYTPKARDIFTTVCKCVPVMLRREGWRTTTSAYIASTRKRACLYGIAGRASAGAGVAGNGSRRRWHPIPSCAWTLSVTPFSMDVVSGCGSVLACRRRGRSGGAAGRSAEGCLALPVGKAAGDSDWLQVPQGKSAAGSGRPGVAVGASDAYGYILGSSAIDPEAGICF